MKHRFGNLPTYVFDGPIGKIIRLSSEGYWGYFYRRAIQYFNITFYFREFGSLPTYVFDGPIGKIVLLSSEGYWVYFYRHAIQYFNITFYFRESFSLMILKIASYRVERRLVNERS